MGNWAEGISEPVRGVWGSVLSAPIMGATENGFTSVFRHKHSSWKHNSRDIVDSENYPRKFLLARFVKMFLIR